MKRPRLVATVLACAGVFVASALAATRAYFVEPKLATSGWTPEDEYVGQSFVANVDSIYYLEWFVGDLSASGFYVFDVLDQATSQLIAHGQKAVPGHGWQWVRCDNWTQGNLQFTKGKEYVLKVSHSAGDSVNFVYRTDNPYSYGHISVSGGELVPEPDDDLVARVYGRMEAVDRADWGMLPEFPYDDTVLANLWVDRCTTAGVGAVRTSFSWERLQEDVPGPWDFTGTDANLKYIGNRAGCRMIGCLGFTAPGASSRYESVNGGETAWSVNCAPRNLAHGVGSGTNYWAGYIDTLVRHIDSACSTLAIDSIHTWEIWNEPGGVSGT